MLFWVLQSESVGLRHAAAAGVLTVSAVVAGWDWFHSIEGMLEWDGQAWTWTTPGGSSFETVRLECHLDLQSRVLLLVRGIHDRFAHWVWWERRQNPMRWMDARRALFSRARQSNGTAADKGSQLA